MMRKNNKRKLVFGAWTGLVGAVLMPICIGASSCNDFHNTDNVVPLSDLDCQMTTLGMSIMGFKAGVDLSKYNTLEIYNSTETGQRIEAVESRAFYENSQSTIPTNIKKIIFDNHGVKTISIYSFCNAPFIGSIIFPDSLEFINIDAFKGCTISSLQFNDGLEWVMSAAFSDCPNLNFKLLIPDSVTEFASDVFVGCPKMTLNTITNDIEYEGQEIKGDFLYSYTDNGHSHLWFISPAPDNTNAIIKLETDVWGFSDECFENNRNITKFWIPTTTHYLGRAMFYWSLYGEGQQLQNIFFPINCFIKEIPYAFCQNMVTITNKLTDIYLPNSIEKIGDFAFEGCDLKRLDVPSGVKVIGGEAFAVNTSLATVGLPEGLLTIGDSAFADTQISGIIIPASVTSIGSLAFSTCTLLKTIQFMKVTPVFAKLGSGILVGYNDVPSTWTAVTDIYVPWNASTLDWYTTINNYLVNSGNPNNPTIIPQSAYKNSSI